MSQNHFTLSFPLRSPADAAALVSVLPPLMGDFFQAADKIETIHYSRFTILSEKTLLLLGDFDGEFGPLMADLAEFAGPVLDRIFEHVVNGPATPVADNVVAFVEWAGEHLLQAVSLYSAYPDVTANDIKAMALDSGVTGRGEIRPMLVILPAKSRIAFFEVELLLRVRGRGITHDLDSIGTPHFAHFVPLEDNQIGFFTVHDGSFENHIADFIKNLGPVFDLLFKFIKGAPPSPCQEHLQQFIDFAAHANRTPIGFYQAYPGLTVSNIHALIGNRPAESSAT
jgi:hypothetical protein